MSTTQYFFASLLLVTWCTLHSALISNSVISWIQRNTGRHHRFYRLFFNIFATASFLPILYYFETLPTELLFRWDGELRIVQFSLIALSLYLFIAGARRYDAFQFLGLQQLFSNSTHKMLNKSGKLDVAGLHKIIRHPWYSGSIIIIWARNLDSSALIQNIILTCYLIIGTYLEERKLLMEFGQEYRDYQQRVSMLLPAKWLMSKVRK